jgi:cadmium resistance protein CadD (predicted permease)
VHSVVAVVLVASLAYVGTMFDNFFAFAAQLVITDRRHYRRIGWAQALGILMLLVVASGVGSLLAPIPTRWIGLLCVAPWALALHAWRHRDQPAREQFRRGALTTFMVTLALGGDNLAVWIPLLRAHGAAVGAATVAIFIVWECLSSSPRRHSRAIRASWRGERSTDRCSSRGSTSAWAYSYSSSAERSLEVSGPVADH